MSLRLRFSRVAAALATVAMAGGLVIAAQASPSSAAPVQQPAASINFDDQDPSPTPPPGEPVEEDVQSESEADNPVDPENPPASLEDVEAGVLLLPELKACKPGTDTVQSVPADKNVGNSDGYPAGPRSCSWSGKKTVTFKCWEGNGGKPIFNVVANRREGIEERRKAVEITCDGKNKVISPSQFPSNGGNHWHIHVHINRTWPIKDATFKKSYWHVG